MIAERGWARAAPGSYVHANAAFGDELGRLRLLEARYDPHTFRRLGMFGPLAGARYLEVGAGAGSVARWLAAQAGPSGQVVATDSDPRFLADTDKAGVEVRRHDILADPPAPGRPQHGGGGPARRLAAHPRRRPRLACRRRAGSPASGLLRSGRPEAIDVGCSSSE